jgi:dienelactone hydrolase
MPIEFTCECGKAYRVGEALAGKRARCKACGREMTVPAGPPPMAKLVQPRPVAVAPPAIPAPRCPNCSSLMQPGAVLCVNCGFDARTGKRASRATSASPLPKSKLSGLQTWHIVSGVLALVLLGMGIAAFALSRMAGGWLHALASPSGFRAPAQPTVVNFIQRPPPRMMPGGVDFYSISLQGSGPGLPMNIHLYLPHNQSNPQSLPCVFIAPAGTRLLHGSSLGDGDSLEHLPYVRAGFAVCAYELAGDFSSNTSMVDLRQLGGPVRQFMNADGGLANARAAISYVLAQVPEVDPERLYAAGHSSAATVALDLVAADHRFKGCCAYAPACDVEARWADNIGDMERVVHGVRDFAAYVSPQRHINDFQCPLLVFHADDDGNVATADNRAFVDALRSAGKRIEFVRVAAGGHYDSMIAKGIPRGIEFFTSLGANPQPPRLDMGPAPRSAQMPPPFAPPQPRPAPDPGPGETWTPDPALLAKLTHEDVVVGYAIKLPAAFTRTPGPPNVPQVSWRGSAREGAGTRISLFVRPRSDTRSTRPPMPPGAVPPGGSVDYGTINSIPFTRLRHHVGPPDRGLDVLTYSAYDGDKWLVISITTQSASVGTLELLEASARTIHRADTSP